MFGSELNISPAQVLADERQQQQLAEQARQFQQTLLATAQERAAAREAERLKNEASAAWENKKFGVEQGWKQQAADWQVGEPGRAMALEQFKSGLKPTTEEEIAKFTQQEGIKTSSAKDLASFQAGLKPKDNYIDIGGGLQKNTVDGKISSTGAKEPPAPGVTWKTDESNPAYQISSLGKRELIPVLGETPEQQSARKLKEKMDEFAMFKTEGEKANLPLESIAGGGRTYKKEKPATDKLPVRPANYKANIANGLAAMKAGRTPEEVYSMLAQQYPEYTSELKRIIWPQSQNDFMSLLEAIANK